MGKTRDLFKKIRDTKGTFHAKMGSIKDRNGMDLTEAAGVDAHVCRYIDPVVTGVDARVCRYIDSVVTGVDARVCRVWILWLQVWTHVCAGCGSCGHRCECTCVQVYRSCGHRCGCCGLEMLSRTLPLVVCSWVLDTDFPRSPPCTVPAQCFHWPLYSDGDA